MNEQFFTMGMYAGAMASAIWAYARFPRLRPATVGRAVPHVAVSFAAFHLTPYLLEACGRMFPPRIATVVAVAIVVVPTLSYIYLSWVWLIGRIAQNLSRGPRGGHLAHGSR
jgi:CBS domain containing-hemolysin-like protein